MTRKASSTHLVPRHIFFLSNASARHGRRWRPAVTG